jgi:hypothetical protein
MDRKIQRLVDGLENFFAFGLAVGWEALKMLAFTAFWMFALIGAGTIVIKGVNALCG